MNLLKRRLPERIIRRLSRHPIAVVSTLSLTLRLGKDAYRVKSGKIDPQEFRARAGSHVGALSGGLLAAQVGSALGTTLLPGIGTILGGFAGGILGEELGSRGGRRVIQSIEKIVTGREPVAPRPDGENSERVERSGTPSGQRKGPSER